MVNGEREYLRLIEKVREIDEDAAKYLEKDAREIDGFCLSGQLKGCMTWVNTPQGQEYWSIIANKL